MTAMEFLVGAGGLVGVFAESKTVLDKLITLNTPGKNNSSRLEFKWRQRFYRSCSTIKIKFGAINHLDELSPLNFINNALDLSVNMILLGA